MLLDLEVLSDDDPLVRMIRLSWKGEDLTPEEFAEAVALRKKWEKARVRAWQQSPRGKGWQKKYYWAWRQSPQGKEYQKEYMARLDVRAKRAAKERGRRKRPEAKAYQKVYGQRPEAKAYQKAYQKDYQKAYRQRPEVKAYQKAYKQTKEYKAYMKDYNRAYRQRQKGQEICQIL
jgi:hypothetical protein